MRIDAGNADDVFEKVLHVMANVHYIGIESLHGTDFGVRKTTKFLFVVTGGTNVSLSMLVGDRVVMNVFIGDTLKTTRTIIHHV